MVEESLRGAALWDEVKDKLDKSAYALSGGQQQRLCIARTLALTDVTLFDELLLGARSYPRRWRLRTLCRRLWPSAPSSS